MNKRSHTNYPTVTTLWLIPSTCEGMFQVLVGILQVNPTSTEEECINPNL